MEVDLVQKGLDLYRRKKRLVLMAAALGVAGYGLYKVYNSPVMAKRRQRVLNLMRAMYSVAEVVADSAETVGVVSKDLKEFLRSDADEIPTSLRQISKIVKSDEFAESVSRVSQAVTKGVLRGYKSESGGGGGGGGGNGSNGGDSIGDSRSMSDRVLDRLFSTAGTGFSSVVVGSFARNMVLGIYSGSQVNGDSSSSDGRSDSDDDSSSVPRWINVVCSDDKCRAVIADSVQVFVSTAVAVYLDKTMNINTYDEIFSGLTNPSHETKVRDMLVSVCSGAVETLVRTSHQVFAAEDGSAKPNLNSNSNSNSSSFAMEHANGSKSVRYKDFEDGALLLDMETRNSSSTDGILDNGWVGKVSSTLSVPNNRRFLLDLTGRVTYETVKSCLDFFLWRMLDLFKRGSNFVRDEVIERGIEVMRYISAKSAVIFTVCFALCLRVIYGTRVMVPA
ncbi:hypothetical protein Scep_001217 [Stephania cephalantha]|uniref:Protein PHLOEM PROTEIN 2-LIKE A10 n=1 Tax=Stephania cephalantha TaxID=152367 RepID=A0AAP0L7R1_9MAGN